MLPPLFVPRRVKKGVKRGREPAAKKETTTATKAKAREPPAKKVKKAAGTRPSLLTPLTVRDTPQRRAHDAPAL